MACVTSQGSPYQRFRRALATGNPLLAWAACAELPRVELHHALALVLLLGHADDPNFHRARARWVAHYAQQTGCDAIEAELPGACLTALAGRPGRAAGRAIDAARAARAPRARIEVLRHHIARREVRGRRLAFWAAMQLLTVLAHLARRLLGALIPRTPSAPASAKTASLPTAAPPSSAPRRPGKYDAQLTALTVARPGITVAQAAREIGVDPTALYPAIRRLEQLGRLRKLGRELHPPR